MNRNFSRFRLCSLLLSLVAGCGKITSTPENPLPNTSSKMSTERQVAEDLKNGNASVTHKTDTGFTTVVVGSGSAHKDLESDKPTFFPVLRNLDKGDIFTHNVVNVPISSDLGVFACRKVKRPNGRIGMDYVLKEQLADYGLTDSQLIELCYKNFAKSEITVTEYRQKQDRMMVFSDKEGFVNALLGDPNTNADLTKKLNTKELAIVTSNECMMLVTTRGSSFEVKFSDIAKDERKKGGVISLNPAVYHWPKGGRLVLVPEK